MQTVAQLPATGGQGRAWQYAAACLALLVMVIAGTAHSQGTGSVTPTAPSDTDHLGSYAAQVSWRLVRNQGNSTWVCRGEGSTIYLGGGRFLTAAHVVDQNPYGNDCASFGIANLVIEFGSARLGAQLLAATYWSFEHRVAYRDGADLALLTVDAAMIPPALRSVDPLPLCETDLPPATAVLVATEYGIYAARTVPATATDYARIDLAGMPGHSGGGVIDPARRCLVGVVSQGGFAGTNYVRNEVLRSFMAARRSARHESE